MADIEKIEQALRETMKGVENLHWETRGIFNLSSGTGAAADDFTEVCSPENIRTLLDELSRLRTALKPFAKEAEAWIGYDETEPLTEGWQNGPSTHLNVGHLRIAARALSERKEGQANG